MRKLHPILRGNHPAAVVYAPFGQRIARMIGVLHLHIDDQLYLLSALRRNRIEPYIIGGPALRQGCVLRSDPADPAIRVRFVRRNRNPAHDRLPDNILRRNLGHLAVFVLIEAAFHDPRQDDLLRQNPLAGRVVPFFFPRRVNALRHRCLYLRQLDRPLSCLDYNTVFIICLPESNL